MYSGKRLIFVTLEEKENVSLGVRPLIYSLHNKRACRQPTNKQLNSVSKVLKCEVECLPNACKTGSQD